MAKLLTAPEVAEILGVSLARIYELTRMGKIPFVRVGDRQYRYSAEALARWIENGGNRIAAEEEEKRPPT